LRLSGAERGEGRAGSGAHLVECGVQSRQRATPIVSSAGCAVRGEACQSGWMGSASLLAAQELEPEASGGWHDRGDACPAASDASVTARIGDCRYSALSVGPAALNALALLNTARAHAKTTGERQTSSARPEWLHGRGDVAPRRSC